MDHIGIPLTFQRTSLHSRQGPRLPIAHSLQSEASYPGAAVCKVCAVAHWWSAASVRLTLAPGAFAVFSINSVTRGVHGDPGGNSKFAAVWWSKKSGNHWVGELGFYQGQVEAAIMGCTCVCTEGECNPEGYLAVNLLIGQ